MLKKPLKYKVPTGRKFLFAQGILKGWTQTKSAIEAGYSKKSAHVNASRLLKNDKNLIYYINSEKQKAVQSCQIDVQRIINEEKCISLFNPKQLFDEAGSMISPEKLPDEIARNISNLEVINVVISDKVKEVRYKYKFWDKGKSLERLSKHMQMYNDTKKDVNTKNFKITDLVFALKT